MSKNYFIFDTNKCVGCEACMVACINENGFQQPDTWRQVYESIDHRKPYIPLLYLSMACNHCDEAPCMASCPALAYSRSGITGAVLHETNKCIGCQYCTWTCPYEAPKYVPSKGVIEKCNFCEPRLIEGNKPACVSLCPTAALDFSFGEITKAERGMELLVKNDPKPSLIIKTLEKGSGPEVDPGLYIDFDPRGPNSSFPPLKACNEPVELGVQRVDLLHSEYNTMSQSPSYRKKYMNEWPLFFFTIISAFMVGITASGFFQQQSNILKWSFPIIGLISAFISIQHLGNKGKAWRALLNLKGSWLSREIFFFTLFYALGTLGILFFKLPLWVIMSIGTLFLLSIDMLYLPVQPKRRIHSAQATLIGLSVYFLFNFHVSFFAGILAFRLFLYIRWSYNNFSGINLLRMLSAIVAVVLLSIDTNLWLTVSVFFFGEFIDRILFYCELNKPDVLRLFQHATPTGSK